MSGAAAVWLPGGRLHLHHGPIDLIVQAEGPGRDAAHARAARRFDTVLEELAAELPRLRAPAGPPPKGPVARRMARAVAPFAEVFVTPMAAVAGAVADEILGVTVAGPGVTKAHVNNGGDVAFHLTPGSEVQALVAAEPPACIRIGAEDPVRGIATSGWRGRSHSLGIADSVTVLARTAAAADVAATLIANAVDLPGHPAVRRRPASEMAPDSDLGDRPVTVAVGALTDAETDSALAAGLSCAARALERGLIAGAALTLRGRTRTLGPLPLIAAEAQAGA